MSQEEDLKLVSIVEAREEQMVSPAGENGTPTFRLARFLKPSETSLYADTPTPSPPLPKTQPHDFDKFGPIVQFGGWNQPMKNWKPWVDDLKSRYETRWKSAGIYEAIIISTYNFRKEEELVLGLADLWCSETNTFVFSWGEATITLEDVLIIAGLPVLGESVTSPLTGELLEIEKKLTVQYYKILGSKAQKVEPSAWLKQFKGMHGELEHAAFLSLWISRFIFPMMSEKVICNHIFPIAVHLSRGTRVALAPALLASLYRDLRVLKEKITVSSNSEDHVAATVWAPFQIVQIWAWERFQNLQPNWNSLNPGDPRAARWNKSKSKVSLSWEELSSYDDFHWRPYSYVLNNWQHPLYNKEQCGWVITGPDTSEELLSFCRCIMPCELIGLDCIEQYAPHRVGMQFGFDQDIPGPFAKADDKAITKIVFYIPPRLFESDVTEQYFNWWNHSGKTELDKGKSILESEITSPSHRVSSKSSGYESLSSLFRGKPSGEDKSLDVEEDKMSMSEWCKQHQGHVSNYDEATVSSKCFVSPQVQCSSSTADANNRGDKQTMPSTDTGLKDNTEVGTDTGLKDNTEVGMDLTKILDDSGDSNFPGPELEDRIATLEDIVRRLKEKRRA